MAIDREQLLHVAHLARLELREDEVERLEGQLNDILEAVSKVSELDLSDVPPTSHPLEVVNVWQDDEPRPCLPVEEALANAPEREGDFFKVPPGGTLKKSPSRSGAFASASSAVRHGRGSSCSQTLTTSSGCEVGGMSARSSSETLDTASRMSFSCASRRSISSARNSSRAK